MTRGTNIGLLVVQIALVLVLVTFAVLLPKPWNIVRVAGLALVVISAGFLFLARLQLGDSFSVTAQAHHLVTHGLYSRIRNPIYVFGGLLLVGFSMSTQVPAILIILVAVIPAQILRARKESKVLEEKFGDEYRQYRAGTWF